MYITPKLNNEISKRQDEAFKNLMEKNHKDYCLKIECPVMRPQENGSCCNCNNCYSDSMESEKNYNEAIMGLFSPEEWAQYFLTYIKKYCLNAYRLGINPLPSLRSLEWVEFYDIKILFGYKKEYFKEHSNVLFINLIERWQTRSAEGYGYRQDDDDHIMGLTVHYQA